MTDLVSFNEGLFATGGYAGTGRFDANAALFGLGGHEHFLLNMEVQELGSMSRISIRMVQEGLSAVEKLSWC